MDIFCIFSFFYDSSGSYLIHLLTAKTKQAVLVIGLLLFASQSRFFSNNIKQGYHHVNLMPISHPFLTRLSSISHQFKPIHFHITSWPHNLASSLLKSSQSISSPSIAVLNHKKNTSSEHVVYNFFLFCHSKQYLYTTCSELVFFL